MKDNYVADIGDYVKYGLLRALCTPATPEGGSALRLGVVWYLFPDPENNHDGHHVHYDDWHACDPDLYTRLKTIRDRGERSVAAVREHHVLPPSTLFYEAPLTFQAMSSGTPQAISRRLAYRRQWVDGALNTVQDADIVFLDPDNGLETASTQRHRARGPKYVYFDEAAPYIQRGQSLVIYQHTVRNAGSVQEQAARRAQQFRERLGFNREIVTAYFSAFGGRFFFILSAASHQTLLSERLSRFAASPSWGPRVQWFPHSPVPARALT